MEFKGTKGKWYLQKYTDAYTNIVRCDDGKGFETLFIAYTPQNTLQEARANALLISKAPEMLEMLDRIVSLESIICMGGAIAEEWKGEAEALNTMMNKVKQLIKEATELQ